MAWTNSKIFVATIEDMLENTTALDLNSDTWKITLWPTTITPDQTVTSANTAYNNGVWLTASEVYDGTEWPQTGQALNNPTFAPTANVLKFDADDEPSDGTSFTTTADVYGVHIHNGTVTTPVDDQGLCYLYLGGPNSVTDGSMTIVFNASGIFTLTL